MKKYLKIFLEKLIAPLNRILGYKKYEIKSEERYAKHNLLHNFYSILDQVNFVPKHIVDVGANHGTWTREALKYFPDAYYTLIEPQQQMKSSIEDILRVNSKVKFHAVGAGKETGNFMFTIVDRDDSCSFIYSAEEAKKQGFRQIEIPIVRLNDFLPTTNFPTPDIIKIDAEGLDLEVLSGADNFFGKTEIFIVEAGVMNKIYNNSFLKIIVFMDKNGYRLFDVTDLNRTLKNNALWLVELVFIKRDGFIDKSINSYN